MGHILHYDDFELQNSFDKKAWSFLFEYEVLHCILFRTY